MLSPDPEALFARHSIELLAPALNESMLALPIPSEPAHAALFLRACRLICDADAGSDRRRVARVNASIGQDFCRAQRGGCAARLRRTIRQAANLLTGEGHRSVTEIAFASGFNVGSHFGRVFARRMQINASGWRQQQGDRPVAT